MIAGVSRLPTCRELRVAADAAGPHNGGVTRRPPKEHLEDATSLAEEHQEAGWCATASINFCCPPGNDKATAKRFCGEPSLILSHCSPMQLLRCV